MSTTLPSQYEGEQIILSSGRLILNGRSDSVFLSSNQYIHINANEGVYIDVGPEDTDNIVNKFYINSPLIQLGDEKKGNLQAVVKADDLKQILTEMVNAINNFNELAATSTKLPPVYAAAADFLKIQLNLSLQKLDNPGFYKSNITKTI
jgi:hypothetical protein